MEITRRQLLGGAALTLVPARPGPRFFCGTPTGIVRGRLDRVTGRPVVDRRTTAVTQASWLAAGPLLRYAVSEQRAGQVHALAADLSVLSSTPTGDGPAHVTVHPGGRFLFVSLYGGGAVATHPIDPDGRVGTATDLRRHGPASHAHQVVVDPTGAHLLAVDLGLDAVIGYKFAAGRLTEVSRTPVKAGSGPRHLAFHPGGEVAYLVNERASTVTVCTWRDGVLRPGRSVAAAPDRQVVNRPAEIIVSADGRFVYVSNRGTNTVAVFTTGPDGTALRRIAAPDSGGNWPRHLALGPGGTRLYVANQRSGTVTWLPIDPATGIPGPAAGALALPGVAHILLQDARSRS